MERYKESNGKVKETGYGKFVRFGIPFLLMLAIIGVLLYMNATGLNRYDKKRLQEEEYQAVYFAMYDIASADETMFDHFLAQKGLRTTDSLDSAKAMAEYLELAFSSQNELKTVYLGVDPSKLGKNGNPEEELNGWIMPYVNAHSDVTFMFLLPPYSSYYWAEMKEDTRNRELQNYETVTTAILSAKASNTRFSWLGNQEWAICNPANYETDLVTPNEDLTNYVVLSAMRDGGMISEEDSGVENVIRLREILSDDSKVNAVYPDLRDYCIVFIGDSIFGNYTDSMSIPGVVKGLSGAHVYNIAVGGTPAGGSEGIMRTLQGIKEGNPDVFSEELIAHSELEKYLVETKGKTKQIFVINYGLNDYFFGWATDDYSEGFDSYGSALRNGLTQLKELYPEAVFVLATPTYSAEFEGGSIPQSEYGSVLEEYASVARSVASEMDVICLDNYKNMGISQKNIHELTVDGTHLNEIGRYIYARALLDLLW